MVLCSRIFIKADRNYSVTVKDFLAVIYGITAGRSYIFGENFDVHTDHNCFRWRR